MQTVQIQQKQDQLKTIAQILKSEFIGLDAIIDSMLQTITAWYMFPELQRRPVVVNLWGLTGTGKTSIVKRLVQLLGYEKKFYLFDMGSNAANLDTLKMHVKKIFRYTNGEPVIFGFDEFQYANTINERSETITKTFSRAVWDILDMGKIQVDNGKDIEQLVASKKRLEYLIEKGVTIKNGHVHDNLDYYFKIVSASNERLGSYIKDAIEERQAKRRRTKEEHPSYVNKALFYASDDVRAFEEIYETEGMSLELVDALLKMDHEELLKTYTDAINQGNSRKEIDCSKCLIFIMGNLDDAYNFGKTVMPDANANLIHKLSKEVTITTIKSTLQKKFKNEQIARLGNNHLLFPSFNKQQYGELIHQLLTSHSQWFQQHTQVPLVFHPSVPAFLYTEGVYPTQGTRPVLSTIQQFIEGNLPTWMLTTRTTPKAAQAHVSFEKNKFTLTVTNAENKCLATHSLQVATQLSNLKKTIKDDKHAVVALHEAGHAVAGIFTTHTLPENIVCNTTSEEVAGFVEVHNDKRRVTTVDGIKQQIVMILAGIAAEELIFGKQNVTLGSENDVEHASFLAAYLVKKSGVFNGTYFLQNPAGAKTMVVYDDADANQATKQILDECFATALQLLQQHKEFLLVLAKQLFKVNRLSKKQIQNLLAKQYPAFAQQLKTTHFSYANTLLAQPSVPTPTLKKAIA